ncbi:FimV/HubP family polar landmark protein [Psychrobacter aestuarii]|uniref:Pilus assembly protein FimV n=1 Tax=Psychrobacter aestuarii TaxID=556327 RepID=A0ABP3F9Z5_9GAMM|nr:FimV/HubP family polar landmark protein [Psychrobacter aestuarii]
MDNMLYIIVGLVIIAGIAFVVMRGKNKPSQAPSINKPSTRSADTSSAAPQRTNATPEPITKFDNLTVAQRFMDQQRYDKAIEAIDRGLAANPTDSALLLKLLQVHNATQQPEAFYQTYAKLETHADPVTMVQAQQLKAQFDETRAPAPVAAPISTPAQSDNSSDFGGLAFEIEEDKPVAAAAPAKAAAPTQQTSAPTAAPVADTKDDNDASFDLILDDLNPATRTTDAPTQPASPAPIQSFEQRSDDTLDNDNDFVLDLPPSTDAQTPSNQALDEAATPAEAVTLTPITQDDAIDNDTTDALSLDFDAPEHTSTAPVTRDADTANTEQADTPAPSTLDDDFTLDFDSLLQDANADDIHRTSSADSDVTAHIDDDFTLSTDDSRTDDNAIKNDDAIDFGFEDVSAAQDNTDALILDTKTVSEADKAAPTAAPQADAQDDFADFTLFDSNEAADVTEPTTDSTDEPAQTPVFNLEEEFGIVDNSSTPVAAETETAQPAAEEPMLFDDDFDIDALISDESPVVEDATEDASAIMPTSDAPTDDSLLPPTDNAFDFVKTLDSNQTTLALAEQYFSIGEYDGAKRLLKEVVSQGNSEQQQQANTLLARIA